MFASSQKILITGGATGIGLGLTERFIRDGHTVLICSRREAVLREVAERFPSVVTRVCDLAVESEREALYTWIQTEHADLNVLVNNAGIQNWMQPGDPEFYERAKQEVAINVLAPVHLTQLFLQLPSLNTIMNVSSGLAFVPLAKVPVYCATKAFMRSWTLSLRHSLKDRQVEVIEVIPPALNTDLGAPGIHDAFPPVSAFVDSIFSQLAAGAQELSFGTSTDRLKVNTETTAALFDQMNAR